MRQQNGDGEPLYPPNLFGGPGCRKTGGGAPTEGPFSSTYGRVELLLSAESLASMFLKNIVQKRRRITLLLWGYWTFLVITKKNNIIDLLENNIKRYNI